MVKKVLEILMVDLGQLDWIVEAHRQSFVAGELLRKLCTMDRELNRFVHQELALSRPAFECLANDGDNARNERADSGRC